MKEIKKLNKNLKVVSPLLALFIAGMILCAERTGVVRINTIKDKALEQNAQAELPITDAVIQDKDTLVLMQANDKNSVESMKELKQVLDDMRVSYDIEDVETYSFDTLNNYKKLILGFTNLDLTGTNIHGIMEWVKMGGSLLNIATYDMTKTFQVISGRLGINEGGKSYAMVNGLYADENFMIGAKDRKFMFDEAYAFSLAVLLDDECKVYIRSVDNDMPLLWEKDYGNGKFVVVNQALTGKAGRGFMAMKCYNKVVTGVANKI